MAGAHCSLCGREEFLPFRCKLCAQPHCLEHRLPENHDCHGLGEYRARVRDERAFGLARDEGMVTVRGPSPLARAGGAMAWFRRSMSHRLIGVILLVYVAQLVSAAATGKPGVLLGAGELDPLTCALAAGDCPGFPALGPGSLASKPWGPLTSIFAHASLFHLFFNALVLYFFGLSLEQRIGSRKLLGLFLGTGVLAAIVQVLVFSSSAVVGASGAIMGIIGTLTVLAPTMQVLLLFIPIPLWVMTVFYAIADLTGLFGGPRGIANLAHLAGLAAGLAYGARLRQRGVMPKITSSWASQRRW
ncbi:MAG TPA: rhomboid family intramembrane serine protease [Candidatus Thermoplasmatota archaeon]|jgi:hypothetical protein|nr:rhomboid family intramembrane serine protease [Candidatus Thermoplasmatota archaeon]